MIRPLLRLPALALAIVVCLAGWPGAVRADAGVVSPTEYRDVLNEVLLAADAALAVLPAGAPLGHDQSLRQAMDRLEGISQVDMGGGVLLAVDGAIVQQMETSRSTERLRQTISALDVALAHGAEPANARARLDQVLARPEFGSGGKSVAARLAELRAQLARWLESVFPNIDLPDVDLSTPLTIIEWLFVGGLVIFAVAFLIFGWMSARPSLLRGSSAAGSPAAAAEDAESARFAAERAAARADYRLALHYLLLWAILRLAEQSRLRFDRSLTNREQVRVLAVSPDLAQTLPGVMDAFDRVWYGHASCGPAEYAAFRSSLERIVEATP